MEQRPGMEFLLTEKTAAKTMTETIYDVAIVGGGPAGYTAAIRAAEYGLKEMCIRDRAYTGQTRAVPLLLPEAKAADGIRFHS